MRLLLATLVVGLIAVPASMLTPITPQAQQVQDTLQPRRDSLMNAVLAQIAGKEELPAEEVFTNIKTLTGIPAGRMLRMMNQGYARNLGVGCDYCHNTDDYGADDKKEKQTARGMIAMVATIAGELGKITTIKSERPIVNCGTCHRGVARPGVRPPAGE